MSNNLPPIFVISLARETERRAAMQRELAEFEFEFVDAVDGNRLATDSYRSRLQTEWWRRMRGRELSRGEIGAFLSHYAVWERLVQANTPYAIVLEDDARLEDGFAPVVEEIMKAEAEWEFVYLAPKKRYRMDRVLPLLGGSRSLVRFRRRAGGAVGYLIRREAAEVLLHYCWRIRAPIDWLTAEWWQNGLRYYAVDPRIVSHAGLPSTIRTNPKVSRDVLEHIAAGLYRWADRLHLRAARRSS